MFSRFTIIYFDYFDLENYNCSLVQAEPDKKPTAVDTAPVFGVRESRSRAWFSCKFVEFHSD